MIITTTTPETYIPLKVLRRLPKWAFAEASDSTTGPARLHPDDLLAIQRSIRVQSPWLRAEEAAEYLRCPISRIRKLTMVRVLPCEHDGRRVLYHRDCLDDYLRAGGATSP